MTASEFEHFRRETYGRQLGEESNALTCRVASSRAFRAILSEEFKEVRMAKGYALSEYFGQAMAEAVYDKLEDGTYGGRIPACQGVVAFGGSWRECEAELQSTLFAARAITRCDFVRTKRSAQCPTERGHHTARDSVLCAWPVIYAVGPTS